MNFKMQFGETPRLDEPDWRAIRNRMQPRSSGHAVRSLATVAVMLGLSRQRVHEIEADALRKLRHAFVREMPSLKLQMDDYGRVCGLTEADFDV